MIYRVMKLDELNGKWSLLYLVREEFDANKLIRYLRRVVYLGQQVNLEVWNEQIYDLALREDMVCDPQFGEGAYGL